jgi:hypothetical protein
MELWHFGRLSTAGRLVKTRSLGQRQRPRPKDVIAVTSEKELYGQSDPTARRMSLEGLEALELYGAQMEQNLVALAQQAALLQAALAERTELIRQIVACIAKQEEFLRELESSRKIIRGIG